MDPIARSAALTNVYLDTSVIVAAIIEGSEHHQSSVDFCERLTENRSRIFFSLALRIELSQAVRKLATRRDRLDAAIRHRFNLDRWETDRAVRSRWLSHGEHQFDQLLGTFAEVGELPFRVTIWRRSIALMVDHHLQSFDAVHAATAQEAGVTTFATLDDDFKRVPGLTIIVARNA